MFMLKFKYYICPFTNIYLIIHVNTSYAALHNGVKYKFLSNRPEEIKVPIIFFTKVKNLQMSFWFSHSAKQHLLNLGINFTYNFRNNANDYRTRDAFLNNSYKSFAIIVVLFYAHTRFQLF